MPSSNQRTPDAGRYRSSRVHLPRSRLQHAKRDGDRRRSRRRSPGPSRAALRAIVPLRRHAPRTMEPSMASCARPIRRTVHAPPLMWSEGLDRIMADLVRDAGVDWSRLRAVSGSAQQHGSVYVNAPRPSAAGYARSFAATRRPAHRRVLAQHVADLDGLEHDQPVRRHRSGSRRAACARPAHGITRVRALHRAADPQIRRAGARRLRRDGSRSSRQLVARVSARRDRTWPSTRATGRA